MHIFSLKVEAQKGTKKWDEKRNIYDINFHTLLYFSDDAKKSKYKVKILIFKTTKTKIEVETNYKNHLCNLP